MPVYSQYRQMLEANGKLLIVRALAYRLHYVCECKGWAEYARI